MNEQNNTTKRGFSKAFDLVPGGEQASVRKETKAACEWSHTTFYNKKDGKTTISKPEWLVITPIFAKRNIDAKTGEYLKQLA